MTMPLFFLSDFGHRDAYVGIMKSIALSIGHQGPVIDLTHGIPPQDVMAGAVAIEDSLPYLPKECVVCAVIDPGVGTNRRPIAVRHKERIFVGPDNGLFSLVYAQKNFELRTISAGGPIIPARSTTFHGRDVFAPAAALLASRQRGYEEIGFSAAFPVKLDWPQVRFLEDGRLELTIISIDHFGNLGTNLRHSDVPEGIDFHRGSFIVANKEVGKIHSTFEDVPTGSPLAYFNSSKRLSIGMNMGNAAKFFGVGRGTVIHFRPG